MKKTIILLITLAFLSVISSALSQEVKEEKTITALQSALDKDPGNLNLLSELGLAFLKKEKYQQAIEPLEKSIQLQKMIQRLISIWLLHMERLADTLKSLENYKKPFYWVRIWLKLISNSLWHMLPTNAIRKPANIIKKPSS